MSNSDMVTGTFKVNGREVPKRLENARKFKTRIVRTTVVEKDGSKKTFDQPWLTPVYEDYNDGDATDVGEVEYSERIVYK